MLLTVVLTGTVHARWQAATNQALGILISGNVSLTAGSLAWSSPTAGDSGTDAASLARFVANPGDQVIIVQTVTGDFQGDNLAVQLRLDWTDLPDGVTSTWHLASADGVRVAPASGEAALGQALRYDNLVGAGPMDWQIVVNITLPGGDPLYGDPTHVEELSPTLDVGQLVLFAEQVRQGTGFTDAA